MTVPTTLEHARHRRSRYRKGETIYAQGDAPTSILRVERGCVRLQLAGADGRRRIVAFLFEGDYFGMGDHATAAEAVTDVELTRFSLQSVLELSIHSSEMQGELVRVANMRFLELALHLERLTHEPALDRVLWMLSWLARRSGAHNGELRLPMGRRDMGDFLGLSPETLSRVLRGLERAGALKLIGQRTVVLHRSIPQGRDLRTSERAPECGGAESSWQSSNINSEN